MVTGHCGCGALFCEVKILRKLMWFAVGFAAACAMGAYLFLDTKLLFLAGICLAFGLSVWFLPQVWGKPAAVMLLGCCIGLCWIFGYNHVLLLPLRALDGKNAELTILTTDYSYETQYGVAADGKVNISGRNYKVRFYLDQEEALTPGDTVTGTFTLRVTASGGEQEATYHQGEGIYLLAYGEEGAECRQAEGAAFSFFAATLRQRLLSLLDSAFPEDTVGFARAVLLGDTGKLSAQTDNALKISGIRHVIAVSGLHVSILFSFLYALAGKRRYITAMIGIPVIILFAAVAGFTPSITRACVMQILMILALLFNKEYDPPTALSFAVLAILICNPFSITSVSLQLSAGCMVGIFLFSGRISRFLQQKKRFGYGVEKGWKPRINRWAVSSVSITVSTMIVTTPLCALYFGQISLMGILTNLLTLWVITFVFCGVILVCLLTALWLPLGKLAAFVISLPIRYVLGVSGVLAKLPLAAVHTASVYMVAWLIFCYIAFDVFLRLKKKRLAVFLPCLLVSFCVCVGFSWAEPRMDNYRMTVFDVGQGQCILLQSKGKSYLVDCGGDYGENAAEQAVHELLSQGIFCLDGLILTHYDKDHTGGVEALLSRVSVDRLYLPQPEEEEALVLSLKEQYGKSICYITQMQRFTCGKAEITIVPPVEAGSSNERSLCILFQTEECDILITGDRTTAGERELLEQIDLPKLEVLVVGHHGSKSSTGLPLLAATRPSLAVISVGKDNSYGHPDKGVLRILDIFGCYIMRTDLEGTIRIRG